MLSKIVMLAAGIVLGQGAFAQTPPALLSLSFDDALARAKANSAQLISANLASLIAREDTVQAKAALLPNVSTFNQFIYTQPNGQPSGVFIANDGPRVYNNWLTVHGDVYAPAKFADYHKAQLAEVVARAKTEIAVRGLVATVIQDYYSMVAAGRKLANAKLSEEEARRFLDITEKQERGGEVAHSDTVLAQVLMVQRQRDSQEAQLAVDKARLTFAVILFPDFRQDFAVVDDLASAHSLPEFAQVQAMASENNPDVRAAVATVEQQNFELKSARAERLPSISFDYFYGMDSNQLAIHNPDGYNNLGSVAQAQMTIPIWNWGSTRSKIKQAELKVQQAKTDLSLTQRQLLSNLHSFFLEAQAANAQVATLRRSLELSQESLRLTMLRYQAGEVSVIEVKDAQITLNDARNAADDGMVRYRVALANLQTLTGTF